MRHTIYAIFIVGALMILQGCSENQPTSPDLQQSDQVTTTLAKAKSIFSGTSESDVHGEGVPTILPNGKIMVKGAAQYLDECDDPRVSGLALWSTNKKKEEGLYSAKLWGKIELFVGITEVDQLDEALGKWDISFHGTKTGPFVVIEATGQGKEGNVKGLVAKWTYRMTLPIYKLAIEGFIFEK